MLRTFLLRALQLVHVLPPVLLALLTRRSCRTARRHTDPLVGSLPVSFCVLEEPERSSFRMGTFCVAVAACLCEMGKVRALLGSVEIRRIRIDVLQARNQMLYASVALFASAFFSLQPNVMESLYVIRGGYLSGASFPHLLSLYATEFFFVASMYQWLTLALTCRSLPFNARSNPCVMGWKTAFFIVCLVAVLASAAVDPLLPLLPCLLGRHPASLITDVQLKVDDGSHSATAQRETVSRPALAYWLNTSGLAQRLVWCCFSIYFIASNVYDIEMLLRQSNHVPVTGIHEKHERAHDD